MSLSSPGRPSPVIRGLLALIASTGPAWAGTVTVTTTADTSNSSDRLCSLREAVAGIGGSPVDTSCVETTGTAEVVQLAAGTYCLTAPLEIGTSLSIRGATAGGTVLDAGNGDARTCASASGDRVVEVDEDRVVTLQDLVVQGGYSTRGGAGVLAASGVDLTLDGVTVRDNLVEGEGSASVGGGGVYLGTGGHLRIVDGEVSDNVVVCAERAIGKCSRGGGVHTDVGTVVEIEDSVVSGNRVDAAFDAARGGGLYLGSSLDTPSSLRVSGSLFSANEAVGDGPSGALGGAIGAEDCDRVELQDSELVGNHVEASLARAFGAGLAVSFCDALVADGTSVRDNSNRVTAVGVGAYGGGVYVGSVGSAELSDATISGNEAVHAATTAESAYGGGLYLFETPTSILNLTVSGNRAQADGTAYGGGIFTKGTITAYVVHSTIALNDAEGGSGGYGGGVGHFPSGSSSTPRSERIVLLSSVLADNTSSGAIAKGADCYEKTYTLGHNVFSSSDDCYLDASLASGTVTDHSDVDAGLSPLADNGGRVETHALGSTSPARGVGSCLDETGATVSLDARGTRRDRRCDAGAWEYGDRRGPSRSTISHDAPDSFAPLGGAEGEDYVPLGWGCATAPRSAALVGIALAMSLVSRRRGR